MRGDIYSAVRPHYAKNIRPDLNSVCIMQEEALSFAGPHIVLSDHFAGFRGAGRRVVSELIAIISAYTIFY